MTGLLELEQNDFFGKTINGPVTGPYEIKGQDDAGMTDIVEYLFLNYGIVTVNNGAENDKAYLRVANAESPENYAKAVEELAIGLEDISNAQPTQGYTPEFNDLTY